MHKFPHRAILAIESSFDDTCVAIVNSSKNISMNLSFNQGRLQQGFRGIIPDLSAKVHKSRLATILPRLLEQKGKFDAIAVTRGPGLAAALFAGVDAARCLANTLRVPLYGINHMAGHALSPRLEHEVPFPYIALIVSGGHTMTVLVQGSTHFSILGETLDDSLGEALDKAAHWLGIVDCMSPLSPAAQLELLAKSCRTPTKPHFPIAMNDSSCDFSFSGLKTEIQKMASGHDQDRIFLAAAFQEALFEQVQRKFVKALRSAVQIYPKISCVVLCGGVARNQRLREL